MSASPKGTPGKMGNEVDSLTADLLQLCTMIQTLDHAQLIDGPDSDDQVLGISMFHIIAERANSIMKARS